MGKKYKALFPAIKAALTALQGLAASAAAEEIRAGKALQLTVGEEEVTLEPEDLQVQAVAPEGYAFVEDAGYMLCLDTRIGEDMRLEGLAREIVRRIQTMRNLVAVDL